MMEWTQEQGTASAALALAKVRAWTRWLTAVERRCMRSLLTEAAGVPVGLAIAGANRHAMQRGKPTLESIPVTRPTPTTDVPRRCA